MPFAFTGASVLEGDIYLIAGDYTLARQFIYNLRSATLTPDLLPPYGFLDVPHSGQTLGGNVLVAGWVFDNSSLNRIEILVDNVVVGTARYDHPRPDVAKGFPNILPNTGYAYVLDTTRYPNGRHTLAVQTVDSAGNLARLGTITVITSNSLPSTKFSVGDRVNVTARRINVYDATAETKIGTQRKRGHGVVIGGPVARNGTTLWNIDFAADPDGLADQNNLEKAAANSWAER